MNLSKILAFPACVLVATCIVACAPEKPAEDEKTTPSPAAPQLIGRIASVPADGRFVLIQLFGANKLPGGTVLTSRGEPDRNANLLITGESLGQFIAADLRAGQAKVGDGVFAYELPKPMETPPQPEGFSEDAPQDADIESETNSENVQKNN